MPALVPRLPLLVAFAVELWSCSAQTYLWRPPSGFFASKGGFSASVSDSRNLGGLGGHGNAVSGAGGLAVGASIRSPEGPAPGAGRAAVSDGEVVRQQLALMRLATEQRGAMQRSAPPAVGGGAATATATGGAAAAAAPVAVDDRGAVGASGRI